MIRFIIYLFILGLGFILLALFYFLLGRSAEKLPNSWRKSLPSKKFRISILFLAVYLFITFAGEIIAFYLFLNSTYNSFIISINFTLATPFLFGFLFIYTKTAWKRYSYILLYIMLIGYFSNGGYYHPDCNLSDTSALFFSSIYFLAVLLYLTDLLVNPKSEHFRFRLKVCISILIYNLLGCLLTSFNWADTNPIPFYSNLIYYIHFFNIVFYYFALDLIIINEIRKLRRNYIHPSAKA